MGTWDTSPELVDALKVLHAEGRSASMTAQILNDKFCTDFSRNAIIGKLTRLGLAGRPKNSSPGFTKARQHAQHAVFAINKAIAEKPLPFIEPEIDKLEYHQPDSNFAVTFAELEQPHCRWPVQDNPFLFCGKIKQNHSSYCPAHYRLAYRNERNPYAGAELERRRRMGLKNFRQMRMNVA